MTNPTMAPQVLPTALLILTILLLSSSPITCSALESFLHCFHGRTNKNRAQILFSRNTSSYNTILLSKAQSMRTIYSTATHKPLLIITPTTPSQVRASVLCARKHGLRIRTRSGGHDFDGLSFTSFSRNEPFVLVDIRNFHGITVDLASKTAWVGAGATLGELYYHLDRETPNYTFPGGTCPTVGIGGYVGGGGIGTLMRKYGIAAEYVVDAVLVDAEGNVLDRSAMSEDVFWAVRGGGVASFGIVLSYKLKLVAVPPRVTAFGFWRTIEQNVTKILRKWERISSKVTEDLWIRNVAVVLTNDGGRKLGVFFQALFLGVKGELLAYIDKVFPEMGVKESDLMELSWIDAVKYIGGIPDRPTAALLDRTPLFNGSVKVKSDYVQKPIGEKGWEKIWEFLLRSVGEPVGLIMEPFGGRLERVSKSATPFPHGKGTLYSMQYYLKWKETDAAVAKRHLDWMRELYAFMAPYVSTNPRGAFLNYRDIDLGTNVEGSCGSSAEWGRQYFKGNFERLVKVKTKVDEHNFFWGEQNIPPACA